MIKTNNKSDEHQEMWCMAVMIFEYLLAFSVELTQKHLIKTSDQPDEEACFNISHSLGWWMVIYEY